MSGLPPPEEYRRQQIRRGRSPLLTRGKLRGRQARVQQRHDTRVRQQRAMPRPQRRQVRQETTATAEAAVMRHRQQPKKQSAEHAELFSSLGTLGNTLMEHGTDPDTIQSVARGLPQLAVPMLGPIPGGIIISYIPVIPLIIAYIVALILVIIILFNIGDWMYMGKLLLAGVITFAVAYGIREILRLIPPIGDRYNARRIPAQLALEAKGVLDNIPIIGTISKVVLAPYNMMLWVASL